MFRVGSRAPAVSPLARPILSGIFDRKRITNERHSGLNSLSGAHSVPITRPLMSGGLRNTIALRRIRGVRFLVIPHVQPPGASRAVWQFQAFLSELRGALR